MMNSLVSYASINNRATDKWKGTKMRKVMAQFCKGTCQFFLASATLFMLLFIINKSQAHIINHDNIPINDGEIKKRPLLGPGDSEDDDNVVVLSLYYESLCPFCANFIVNQLVKVFETDLISVVKLRLIPWGNTLVTANNSWICQHGPDECMLNMVEACAIYAWPDPRVHYKFINCIERLQLNNMHNQWQSCFAALRLSSLPVRNCFSNGLAVKLEQGYRDETAHLNPPHRFVPWVLVNNLPLQEDFQNFVAYICKAYKGAMTPQACGSHSFEVMSIKMGNSTQVCFAENATRLS